MMPKVFLLTLLVVAGLVIVVPWINRRKDPLDHSPNRSRNRAVEVAESEDGRPAPGIGDAEKLASQKIEAPMEGPGDAGD